MDPVFVQNGVLSKKSVTLFEFDGVKLPLGRPDA